MTLMLTNGAIPASLLVPIPGTAFLLRPGPAAAWAAVCHEVQRRYGWTPTLNDAYRDEARQEEIFLARYDHTWRPSLGPGVVVAWRGQTWYRKPGASSAAVPGTSNHGWGTAVDVELDGFGGPRFNQFAAVAGPLGWSNTEGQAVEEFWHWVYTGPTDTVSNVVAAVLTPTSTPPAGALPAPLVVQEDTMKLIRVVETGLISVLTPTAIVPVPPRGADNMDAANALAKVLGPWVDLTAAEFALIRDAVWATIVSPGSGGTPAGTAQ